MFCQSFQRMKKTERRKNRKSITTQIKSMQLIRCHVSVDQSTNHFRCLRTAGTQSVGSSCSAKNPRGDRKTRLQQQTQRNVYSSIPASAVVTVFLRNLQQQKPQGRCVAGTTGCWNQPPVTSLEPLHISFPQKKDSALECLVSIRLQKQRSVALEGEVFFFPS